MSCFMPEDALETALTRGDAAWVRTLLDANADLDFVLQENPKLLAKALSGNMGGVVDACLNSGKLNPNCTAVANVIFSFATMGWRQKEWPLYHDPLNENFLYWVDRFADAGATFNFKVNGGHDNLLHVLMRPYTKKKCCWNDTEIASLKRILDRMSPETRAQLLDQKDKKGYTPLHYAAQTGSFDDCAEKVVKMLVKYGACTTIPDAKGMELIDYAFARNSAVLIAFLREHEARPQIPFHAPEKIAAPEPPKDPEPLVVRDLETSRETGPEWMKISGTQVASVQTVAALGYKLTESFNFGTLERTALSQNLSTGAESRETAKFADLQQQALEDAFAFYAARGGQLRREEVFVAEDKGLGLDKTFSR